MLRSFSTNVITGLFTMAIACTLWAADAPEQKVVFSDDFAKSHNDAWHLNNGVWKITDGGWQGAESAADKHPATTRYRLEKEFTDATFEFDFKFDGAKRIGFSINEVKKHVCRLLVTPKYLQISKDDSDGDGPDMSKQLGKEMLSLQPGQWHHVRLVIAGNEFSAQIGDTVIGGSDPRISVPKESFAFVVSGESASFRNLRVSTHK